MKLQKASIGIKKLVLFDLDETLIHTRKSDEEKTRPPDANVAIKLPSGRKHTIDIYVRPHI